MPIVRIICGLGFAARWYEARIGRRPGQEVGKEAVVVGRRKCLSYDIQNLELGDG